jgi:hypothetical protein
MLHCPFLMFYKKLLEKLFVMVIHFPTVHTHTPLMVLNMKYRGTDALAAAPAFNLYCP